MEESTTGVSNINPLDNKEKVEALMEAGVFDIISGKVEININNGQIQNIHIYQRTYKRMKR